MKSDLLQYLEKQALVDWSDPARELSRTTSMQTAKAEQAAKDPANLRGSSDVWSGTPEQNNMQIATSKLNDTIQENTWSPTGAPASVVGEQNKQPNIQARLAQGKGITDTLVNAGFNKSAPGSTPNSHAGKDLGYEGKVFATVNQKWKDITTDSAKTFKDVDKGYQSDVTKNWNPSNIRFSKTAREASMVSVQKLIILNAIKQMPKEADWSLQKKALFEKIAAEPAVIPTYSAKQAAIEELRRKQAIAKKYGWSNYDTNYGTSLQKQIEDLQKSINAQPPATATPDYTTNINNQRDQLKELQAQLADWNNVAGPTQTLPNWASVIQAYDTERANIDNWINKAPANVRGYLQAAINSQPYGDPDALNKAFQSALGNPEFRTQLANTGYNIPADGSTYASWVANPGKYDMAGTERNVLARSALFNPELSRRYSEAINEKDPARQQAMFNDMKKVMPSLVGSSFENLRNQHIQGQDPFANQQRSMKDYYNLAVRGFIPEQEQARVTVGGPSAPAAEAKIQQMTSGAVDPSKMTTMKPVINSAKIVDNGGTTFDTPYGKFTGYGNKQLEVPQGSKVVTLPNVDNGKVVGYSNKILPKTASDKLSIWDRAKQFFGVKR